MFRTQVFRTSLVIVFIFRGTPATHALPLADTRGTKTRRERLKSALYLRLKNRKTFFRKKISFGKCRTVPKNVKRGSFLIYKHAFCSKITKNSKGDPLGTLKKFRNKVSQCRKKIERGDPLIPSGLVGNV